MRVILQAYPIIIQSDNITIANWTSIELIFILCNASTGHNFINHIDVYQGENEHNIGIVKDLWNLPTAQKVVVNEIVSIRLYMDPNGFHKLYMDNHYSALELFVVLKKKY